MADERAIDLLVVGCGNDLRSDDRAGREVATRVEALALDGVVVRSVTQLVPELAVEVGRAHAVVFVDASVEVERLTVTGLDAAPTPTDRSPAPGARTTHRPSTHHATPASLIRLAKQLGGSAPDSVTVVAIPAHDLGFGELMTAGATAAVDEAVELIRGLAGDLRS